MNLFNYISKTFLVLSFSMLCSFVATLHLGEVLSTEDFGFFNLLKRIIPMGAVIILIGFDKSYIKYFSNRAQLKIFKFVFPMILMNAFLVTILFNNIYDFDKIAISIYFCLTAFSFIIFLSSYARFKNQYGTAQFIQAGYKIIFFIIIIYFIQHNAINSIHITNVYQLSFVIPLFYIFKFLFDENRIKKSASYQNFKKMLSYGLLFFSVNIFNLIIVNMEGLFIPYYYGQEANGIYSGLSFIYITVFVMIGTSVGYVIFPTLSKKENFNIKRLFTFTLIIIFLFSFFFTIFGESINKLAFKGKFDAHRTFELDIMFISIGALQFINNLLHWFILGVGNKKNITNYLYIIIFVLVGYTVLVFSTAHLGPKNFVVIIPIVLFSWFIKILMTLLFIKRIDLIKSLNP